MFASMFGVLLSLFVAFIIFSAIIGGIVSSASNEEKVVVKSNSILEINLERPIQDNPSNNPLENFNFSSFEDETPLSLRSIIGNIQKAKNDSKIKGIYLNIPSLQANLASTEELRKALVDFKESGKFIVSYSESYGQLDYYLCSVADEMYLNPAGDLTFKGLSSQLLFFKDALDRLDIEMQVIRHGKFKSAIEPFIRNDMSAENREQISTLINSIWNNMQNNIAKSRGLSLAELNNIADKLLIRTAEDGVEYGLVDALKYQDEVQQILMEKIDVKAEDDLNLMALGKYKKVKILKGKNADTTLNTPYEYYKASDKIAIIYAEGEIVSGESKDGSMGSNTIAKAIKKAREDKKIKAIVMRVNSPGGSALASDVMWREVNLAKAEKPFIVSMGDVAASGGYYISCAADKIFAENSTITGSIGVFGLIPNISGFLEKKMGVHVDHVNSNTYSDATTLLRPMSDYERDAVQEMVEDIYSDFTEKVATGRGMTQAAVDSIGQGRVWTGGTALQIGLVDQIGGLEEAIIEAAKMAEVEQYRISNFPEEEDPFKKMLENFGGSVKAEIFSHPFKPAERYYHSIESTLQSRGLYMRLPVDILFH